MPVPATDRQRSYLRSLLAERPAFAEAHGITDDRIDTLSKPDASQWISRALDTPRETPPAAATVTEPGIYVLDDTVYRVQPNQARSSLYAKQLVVTDGPAGPDATWEYVGRRPLARLTPEHRLTFQQAAELGHMLGICVRCGTALTDERSVLAGYGETCARHEGWPYPTKADVAAALEELAA